MAARERDGSLHLLATEFRRSTVLVRLSLMSPEMRRSLRRYALSVPQVLEPGLSIAARSASPAGAFESAEVPKAAWRLALHG